jgi:hypothetical protein
VTAPDFVIRAMTAADAHAVAAWRYSGEYSSYDADADPDDLAELLDPTEWGRRYLPPMTGRSVSSPVSWCEAHRAGS